MGQKSNEIGRNDPCPCGCGKKYKHCLLGKQEAIDLGGDANESDSRVSAAIAVAGAILGVVLGVTQGVEMGLGVGGGIVLAVGAWIIFRNPPPPRAGGSDPAAINFGGS